MQQEEQCTLTSPLILRIHGHIIAVVVAMRLTRVATLTAMTTEVVEAAVLEEILEAVMEEVHQLPPPGHRILEDGYEKPTR